MRNTILLVAILIGGSCYSQELLSRTVDVNQTASVILISTTTPGMLNTLTCRVIVPVSSIGGVSIESTIDDSFHITPIYERGTAVWTDAIATMQVVGSPFNPGSNVGDTFRLDLNRAYSKLAIIRVTTFGGGGKLQCTVAR